ncbi:MAG TPA: hypothetical protein PLS52_03840 [Bacteroidales bacterium]|nr:hypothetical protein [Bacteroidales bacterium]HPQ56241.1 hypothetical protein [Bacteroidales bacterium]
MKCELKKIEELSGKRTSIYSVLIEDYEQTLFDIFIEENRRSHLSEIKDIVQRLKTIGTKTGAREQFFKLHEGNPGDGICALFDLPEKNLRLYCIRYNTQIIMGGGGIKFVRALQQDSKLTKENYLLRELSKQITGRIKEKDIRFSEDGNDFEGDFAFNLNIDQ